MPTLPISLQNAIQTKKNELVDIEHTLLCLRCYMTECDPTRKKFTVGKLLLLGLESRGEVEGVEDASRVSALIGGQAVLLEDGVLVDTSRVLDVLPPSNLDIVEQDELDHEEG